MSKISRALPAVLAAAACGAAPAAWALNPLGLYVGADVGQSNVRSSGYASGNPFDLSEHHDAWDVALGLRPISLIGAEFSYIDFGNPTAHAAAGYTAANADAKAGALFAVGYLPLPLPLVDVYAKVGLARLRTDTTVFAPAAVLRLNRSESDPAYGAGLQVKFAALAVRAEYLRIDAGGGNPDLVSIGVTWTF